jgi:hydroxysqualene synthase
VNLNSATGYVFWGQGQFSNQRETIIWMTARHYENFPVASKLCPPALRPAVVALYAYARTADDLADEGNVAPQERLAALSAYRSDLHAVCSGLPTSTRWPQVFEPLRAVIQQHALPADLLADLLSAFEQDVVKPRYQSRPELVDYCRRSANPVGRLLLQLYGVTGAQALQQSDAICTALQLINFWQDLSVDTRRGRIYLPTTDLARFGVTATDVLKQHDSPEQRAVVADAVTWARDLMHSGAALVHTIPGRAGWELRLVVQGGLRILEKIETLQFASLQTRPKLDWRDVPRVLWRALWMRL